MFDKGLVEPLLADPATLPDDQKAFAKELDDEALGYFLSMSPESRESFMKSNPDSEPGVEEEVAVEVAAPDGSVTQVAAAKPAGEAVTVTTPEVSVTSAPAGTQTSVVKAVNGNGNGNGNGGFPPKKKDEEEEEMEGIDKALQSQPIYKARDGSLYYSKESAALAAKVDELEEEKEKEKVAATTEKAFNAYPHLPRSLVKHLVASGAPEQVWKEATSLNSRESFMSKQFGTPVDEDSAANPFESLVAKAMDNGKVPYSKALTEVMKTDAGREAYRAANPRPAPLRRDEPWHSMTKASSSRATLPGRTSGRPPGR